MASQKSGNLWIIRLYLIYVKSNLIYVRFHIIHFTIIAPKLCFEKVCDKEIWLKFNVFKYCVMFLSPFRYGHVSKDHRGAAQAASPGHEELQICLWAHTGLRNPFWRCTSGKLDHKHNILHFSMFIWPKSPLNTHEQAHGRASTTPAYFSICVCPDSLLIVSSDLRS